MPTRQFTVTALKTVTVSSLSYSCALKNCGISLPWVYMYICFVAAVRDRSTLLRFFWELTMNMSEAVTNVIQNNDSNGGKMPTETTWPAALNQIPMPASVQQPSDHNINDTPERHPLLSSGAWWSVLFSISLCYASVWIHAYGSSSTIPTVEAHSTKSPRAQQPAC